MKRLTAVAALLLAVVIISACGSKPAATDVPKATDTIVPTYIYKPPTEPAVFANLNSTAQATAAVESTQAASSLDPELVTRGQGRYVALECGSCHGDKGQGTDKGKALVPTKLSEADFVQFLQTGGNLGNAHLYAGNKLSDSGAHNLYLYVLSLGQAAPAS